MQTELSGSLLFFHFHSFQILQAKSYKGETSMKPSLLTKLLCVSAIAVGVSVSVNPSVLAQTTPTTTDPTLTETEVDDDNDGFDWGWLGLLGLIGLAGLARKPEERTVYPDRTVDPSTTTRSDYR